MSKSNALKKYQVENRLKRKELAALIGISEEALYDIIKFKSSQVTVKTALKIKIATGLEPWEYLNGLETLKKLYEKFKK